MKKYELTAETMSIGSTTLHRIRALVDFNDVKAGDLGGWIEKESNLNQDGRAWVYGEARVYGEAEVFGNARVFGEAEVFGNAWVFGEAEVFGNAWVCGNARVYGEAEVCGDARVFGDARVYGEAEVFGEAWVYGEARVYGEAEVFGNAQVCDRARVCGPSCLLVVSPLGSRDGATTFYAASDAIRVVCGCFSGTLDEFAAAVEETHGDNEHGQAYRLAIELAKLRIKLPKQGKVHHA